MGRIETVGTAVILHTDGSKEELEKFDEFSKLIKLQSSQLKTLVFSSEKLPKGFWKFKNIDYFEFGNLAEKLEKVRNYYLGEQMPEICVEIIQNSNFI